MKKSVKTTLRVLKWILVIGLAAFLLPVLWFGFQYQNPDEGKIKFGWSGFEALTNESDLRIYFNDQMHAELDGLDGPYIIGDSIYNITKDNKLVRGFITERDSIAVRNEEATDNFSFALRDKHDIQPHEYAMPEKLIAISDIEGNFNALSSFLINNGVIDKSFNWNFGKGHVVFLGDFVDRGKEVTQVLWLIYKLEQQALDAGGRVHYILGNHEAMNIQGSLAYVDGKYITAAQLISGRQEWGDAYRYMLSGKTEMGKWLRSKNSVERIGKYLFVHGGIHPEAINRNLSYHDLNLLTRQNIDSLFYHKPGTDEPANFAIGRKGPWWYRGMVEDYKYYDKITDSELTGVLKQFKANKVVIGHTLVDSVSTDFDGKVIRIDVKHDTEKNSPATQGLLIESGTEYRVDGTGKKVALN